MSSQLRVFNTLGRTLEPFEPRDPGRVSMYVCGPTVQSEPHVGHGRFAVVFDMIARYLEWRGFDVTYVRNITDVEDKIIAAANEAGETMAERAARMTAAFHSVFEELAVREPTIEPKATEHIPDMIELIERLRERGLAYPAENGDVYFSVRTLESYGRLSGHNVDDLRAGARVEVSELKEDPLDFALWKAAKPGEPSWDSPWSPGRPGWHIECSAMAAKYLGDGFDIHGGGSDLIFPHHENEIAQSEGASGTTFARYWLHNEMVNLGGEKMSKSTGHVVDLNEAIDRFGGRAVRMVYLRAHYRSPLEFTEELVGEAKEALRRIDRFAGDHPDTTGGDPEVLAEFTAAMDDDFNTPKAMAVMFDAVRRGNRADSDQEADRYRAAVRDMAQALGIELRSIKTVEQATDAILVEGVDALATEVGITPGSTEGDTIQALLDRRAEARASRDFATGDAIRDRLAELGIVVEDTADGSHWYRR